MLQVTVSTFRRFWVGRPLPLFATGLGAMGFVARRRKRKNAAAIAV